MSKSNIVNFSHYFIKKRILEEGKIYQNEIVGECFECEGTGLSKELNFDFYKILQEFKKLSGLPILLNTSLNINSEPIVMTPDDAISNFYNSGLDCIVMGDYFLEK